MRAHQRGIALGHAVECKVGHRQVVDVERAGRLLVTQPARQARPARKLAPAGLHGQLRVQLQPVAPGRQVELRRAELHTGQHQLAVADRKALGQVLLQRGGFQVQCQLAHEALKRPPRPRRQGQQNEQDGEDRAKSAHAQVGG